MERRHMSVTGGCQHVRETLTRIGDKWSVLVIMTLGRGPMRFNELRRSIEGVSQRMLTLTLRGLERDGFVTRTVRPTVPPQVDYELTSLGVSLQAPVRALGEWAFTHQPLVEQARQRYDGQTAPKPEQRSSLPDSISAAAARA